MEELPLSAIECTRDEALVPDPTPFEAEIAVAKLKRYKLPGTNFGRTYSSRRRNTAF
jgi:hypothetical protein